MYIVNHINNNNQAVQSNLAQEVGKKFNMQIIRAGMLNRNIDHLLNTYQYEND